MKGALGLMASETHHNSDFDHKTVPLEEIMHAGGRIKKNTHLNAGSMYGVFTNIWLILIR